MLLKTVYCISKYAVRFYSVSVEIIKNVFFNFRYMTTFGFNIELEPPTAKKHEIHNFGRRFYCRSKNAVILYIISAELKRKIFQIYIK